MTGTRIVPRLGRISVERILPQKHEDAKDDRCPGLNQAL
jgi:hypothetical protein